MPKYLQGDNIPPIKTGIVSSGFDLTDFISQARCTISFSGNAVANALSTDLTLKMDNNTLNRLKSYPLGAGIRAIVYRTKEWILITNAVGSNLTITRAQNDPGGAPTIAADIKASDPIYIIPWDEAPISAMLDPLLTNKDGAIITLKKDHTKIPAGDYELSVVFSNPGDDQRVTWNCQEPLTIATDRDQFGAI